MIKCSVVWQTACVSTKYIASVVKFHISNHCGRHFPVNSLMRNAILKHTTKHFVVVLLS